MSVDVRPDERHLALIGWAAVGVPVLAWMGHLVFSAAYAAEAGRDRIGPSSACTHGIAVWPLHLGTAVGALFCLASLAAALFVHRQRNGSGEGGLSSQFRFLGLLGIGSVGVQPRPDRGRGQRRPVPPRLWLSSDRSR